ARARRCGAKRRRRARRSRRIGVTKTRKPLPRTVAELVLIVAIALGLALAIQAFVVKPYEIPSASMEPTLHIGQRILVDRIGDDFSGPKLGQVWVFHP